MKPTAVEVLLVLLEEKLKGNSSYCPEDYFGKNDESPLCSIPATTLDCPNCPFNTDQIAEAAIAELKDILPTVKTRHLLKP